jgi:hypothetical protein
MQPTAIDNRQFLSPTPPHLPGHPAEAKRIVRYTPVSEQISYHAFSLAKSVPLVFRPPEFCYSTGYDLPGAERAAKSCNLPFGGSLKSALCTSAGRRITRTTNRVDASECAPIALRHAMGIDSFMMA